MRKTILLLSALMVFAMSADKALAEPGNGFSINSGLTSHNMSGTTSPAGAAYSYSSSGLSVGMDYQFALSDNFSISPIFIISVGESLISTPQAGTVFSGIQAPDSAGHGIFGLQLKYWIDDVFIGGHVGSYAEFLSSTNSNTNTTTNTIGEGIGKGLVVGWAPSQSKWFLMGQVDSANIDYLNSKVKLTGTRISIGYRWK